MRLALLLIPYLMRALVYVGIIMLAAPLRAVFSALPKPNQERGQREIMNDTMNKPNWMTRAIGSVAEIDQPTADQLTRELVAHLPVAQLELALRAAMRQVSEATSDGAVVPSGSLALLVDALVDSPEATSFAEIYRGAVVALDDADVPYEVPFNFDGEQRTRRLDLVGRVRWLAENRDWWKGARDAEYKAFAKQRAEAAKAMEEATATLADGHKEITELRGFAATRENQLSLTGAERDALLKDVAFFKDQAERASSETRVQKQLRDLCATRVTELEFELDERSAIIDALEADVAALEEHVDTLEDSSGRDCWSGWEGSAP